MNKRADNRNEQQSAGADWQPDFSDFSSEQADAEERHLASFRRRFMHAARQASRRELNRLRPVIRPSALQWSPVIATLVLLLVMTPTLILYRTRPPVLPAPVVEPPNGGNQTEQPEPGFIPKGLDLRDEQEVPEQEPNDTTAQATVIPLAALPEPQYFSCSGTCAADDSADYFAFTIAGPTGFMLTLKNSAAAPSATLSVALQDDTGVSVGLVQVGAAAAKGVLVGQLAVAGAYHVVVTCNAPPQDYELQLKLTQAASDTE